MANLTSVLNHLQQERSNLTAQLEPINTAIWALNGTGKRSSSAAARGKMAAQKRRWAKWGKAQKGKG